MRRLLRLLPLCGLCGSAPAVTPKHRVLFLTGDSDSYSLVRAVQSLREERPETAEQLQVEIISVSTLKEVDFDARPPDSIVVQDIMSHNFLPSSDGEAPARFLARVRSAGGRIYAVSESLTPQEAFESAGVRFDPQVRAYWEFRGWKNLRNLLLYLSQTLPGVPAEKVPDPEKTLKFGYYYPDGKDGRAFRSWPEYENFYRQKGLYKEGRPWVGVLMFANSFYSGQAAVEDAVIQRLEEKGVNVLPGFGYPEPVAAEALMRDEKGRSRVEAIVSFLFRFSGPQASETLARIGVPVINAIVVYGRSEKEWRESPSGLSTFEGTFQIAVPELPGLVQPTVVGANNPTRDPASGFRIVRREPIPERVNRIADRALAWVRLRRKPAADRKIAVLYYNYPPGKHNIGASYLNVFGTISNLLARLKSDGYSVGDSPLDAEKLLAEVQKSGRNIGSWAPGELEALVASGGCELVPVGEYKNWLSEMPALYRERVLKDWGPPEADRLMLWTDSVGRKFYVIPAVKRGNVVLMPQPVRGWNDTPKMYHDKDLAPPHIYAASYEWIRRKWAADVVMHIGTHGTHEWLSGRDIGFSEEDPPEALIRALPNIYIYNVDVVGEGLVAKRRGMATIVDHMTPPLKKGGLYKEYASLMEDINSHDLNMGKSPELAKEYQKRIYEQVHALGLAKDLGLKLSGPASLDHEEMHKIQAYLMELKGQNMPYGLHTFGVAPPPELRKATIEAILEVAKDLSTKERAEFAKDMDRRILLGAKRELDHAAKGLSGGYIPTGSGNDPIRNPSSLPTGKNFYAIDPTKVPTRAAWEIGSRLAAGFLEEYRKRHSQYPKKLSFVIWGNETIRHEGVLESQILWFLGAKPIWDARGKVVGVEIIPKEQLGRPRVDTVIASAAEGMFPQITQFMDEAVRRVKDLDEKDNFVRENYLRTLRVLLSRGYKKEDAEKRAAVRIFDEPPGQYNLNVSRIVEDSGSWEKEAVVAADYFRHMGHGYGGGFWGEPMEDVFRLALSGTEAVLHSRSSNLYGTLDNDDVFMYAGGLAMAVRQLDGKTPELHFTHLQDPSRPRMMAAEEMIGLEFRSRYTNPEWMKGMMKEGFEGARQMEKFVEYLWGWEATMPELIDDHKWDETYEVYIRDKHGMGLEEFFEKHSPYAKQAILARLLETGRKGYWKPSPEVQRDLARRFVESVARIGPACSENICRNRKLEKFAMDLAPGAAAVRFQQRLKEATQPRRPPGVAKAPDPSPEAPSAKAERVRGYEMVPRKAEPKPRNSPPSSRPLPATFAGLIGAGAFGAGFRQGRKESGVGR